ncbi:MAG: glycosyltransferase, partial [Bacteroidota bacterium]
LTVLMEAMACCRPVIITKNVGLAKDLVDKGLVIGTEPGDILGMRTAIQELLSNPEKASALAQKAYDYFLARHTSEYYVKFMSDIMKEMTPDKASSKKDYSLR